MKSLSIIRSFRLKLLLLALLGGGHMAGAAPMHGEPIEFTQPNGMVIHLQVFGDEFYAETRTLDGYTVFFDSASSSYYFAVLSAGGNEFASSGILVGVGNPPTGLPKKLTIKKNSKLEKIHSKRAADESEQMRSKRWKAIKEKNREKRKQKKDKATASESQTNQVAPDEGNAAPDEEPSPPTNQTTGTRVGLTILVEFPDEAGSITREQVDDYCNKPGYSEFSNKGSIYDYFYTQSDGKLRYNNVVTAYVMAPNPKTYYNDTSQSSGTMGRLLLNDVLQVLIDSGFDFSHCTVNGSGRLHAINMFFTGANSGVWAKGLWPHKYGLSPDVDLGGGIYADQYQSSNMGSSLRMGTFCHETGHLLCDYPDLYDYDDDSNGCGKYTLMASGNHYYQTSPIHVDAYLRYHSGWIETIDIETTSHYRGAVRVDTGSAYQFVNSGTESEYFLINNRAKIGWESTSGLPDQGLLIMHCDESGDHNKQEMTEAEHFELSIEQADGLFHLEYDTNSGGSGDLFHNGDADEFTDSTLPNAHWWANATTDPASGDASGLNIHDIGSVGATMTFIVGAGTLSGSSQIGVDRALLEPSSSYGEAPADSDVAVWNMSGGTLNYSVTSLVGWVESSVTNSSATTESDVVTLSYSTNGLSEGVNIGEVHFINIDNPVDKHILTIMATMDSPPVIVATPSSIQATVLAGEAADPVYQMIHNLGGGGFSYASSGWPAWATASLTNGTVTGEADPVTIELDASSLLAGTYTSIVSIVSAEAANSPYSLPLTLTVVDFVLDPLADNTFTNFQMVTLGWQYASNVHAYVDIELWRDGILDSVVADNTDNDGTFEWAIPGSVVTDTNYTLRIRGDGSSSYEESAIFSVSLYAESFESGKGNWVDSAGDNFNWTRNNNGTGSSGTGPSYASDGNYYLYTEASSANNPNMTALMDNTFDFAGITALSLQFDYHMYGAAMGSLDVDLFDGLVWTQSIWSISGQQHNGNSDPWTLAEVDLSEWAGLSDVVVRFRGTTGSSFTSDMALDNIRLINESSSTVTSNTLGVVSAHGNPSPSVGEYEFIFGTVVTAIVDSIIVSGATQYVCTGWSMLDHEPTAGLGATNIFAITNNASLTWNWDTNYYFTLSSGGSGSVDQSSQWVAANSLLALEAFPDTYYHFDMWSGDLSGSINPLSISSDAPKTIAAHFAENLVTNNTPEWWLALYGLGIADSSALADSDLDMMLNWEEFLAGTNPTNDASLLVITDASFSSNNLFVVDWQAVSGKTYSVLVRTNLLLGAWEVETNGIIGIEPECTYTGLTETAESYIQIRVDN
jgi:M6 family metalloprotease-like protein